MIDKNYKRSELTPIIKRELKRQEKELNRKCTRTWSYTNKNNEHYIFGLFVSNKTDKVIVTIAYYNTYIFKFEPIR